MMYLTKEELDDITKELIENPTRETLKLLNDKYNGSETTNALVKEESVQNEMTSVVVPEVQTNAPEINIPTNNFVVESSPVVEPIPSVSVPNFEEPKVESIPSFELPKNEMPTINNQSNEPVAFSGNLFEMPNSMPGNLMQTTDNFNIASNTMPTTEVPVSSAPFFGPTIQDVSNPIPVSTPVQEPTMFGQIQKNYM